VIARAERLLRVSLTVENLEATERFYREAFGFQRLHAGKLSLAMLTLLDAAGAAARSSVLRLGAQQLELVQFDPPGRPYPQPSTARDPWFQHIAIVVADMDAAYERLRRLPIAPISDGGPQRLPPSSGSVIAFKFRDPESHPLELIEFPQGGGAALWHEPARALFLGFDHSAIVVGDAARSRSFYASQLGLTPISESRNQGPEQQRLDGLRDEVVDVIGLGPTKVVTPHLELLGYHGAGTRTAMAATAVQDVASARLVFEVTHLAKDRGMALEDGTLAAQALDPDGHRLLLLQA
jgi:catechol 2,3-dioxygenase-like lactoylglutathione lyase family enzyme